MLDTKCLQDNGVQGSDKELDELVDHINAELELRVGYTISDVLSAEQLAEAEAFTARGEDIPLEWLETAVPNYQNYVDGETAEIRQGFAQAADKAQYIRELE